MAWDPIGHSGSRMRQSSTHCIELLRNFETKEVTNRQEVLESDKLQQQTIIKTRGNKKRNKKTPPNTKKTTRSQEEEEVPTKQQPSQKTTNLNPEA